MDEEYELRHTLDLARTEIQRLRPFVALAHLNSIQARVEARPHTSISAEHRLLYAGVLAATGDEGAESEFRQALQDILDLPTRDIGLELRAHEDFGNYLRRFTRLRTLAREQYQLAKKLAVECKLFEDSARFELDIVSLDLEINQDPRLGCFGRFKKIATQLGSTFKQQLRAWFVFCGESGEQGSRLVAARKRSEPPDGYFRGLLESVKRDTL